MALTIYSHDCNWLYVSQVAIDNLHVGWKVDEDAERLLNFFSALCSWRHLLTSLNFTRFAYAMTRHFAPQYCNVSTYENNETEEELLFLQLVSNETHDNFHSLNVQFILTRQIVSHWCILGTTNRTKI